MTQVRPIEQARETLNNILEKTHTSDEVEVKSCRVFHQKNFTVALVNEKFIGVSKRAPIDKLKAKTGECYAISRAVWSLIHSFN